MGAVKKFRRKVKYSLIYFLVKFLVKISNWIPRKAWLSFCGGLGKFIGLLFNQYRQMAITHLTMAFGKEKSKEEIKKLALDSFKMLGKNAGDVLRASTITSLDELNKIVVMKGFENYEVADKRGKGVVFIACHLGAFELQITSMALRNLNFMVIGTPLKDKRLNDLMWKHRNRNGTNYVERDKANFAMLKVLKAGGSVALLIDQDTKVKSTFVDFFGIPAATPIGAAMLAMKTGAAVMPAFSHLGEDGLQHIEILPEIELRLTGNEEEDIQYNTQIFSNFIEDRIRKYPAQWVWMHERWKTKQAVLTHAQ
ncbi:MAG TPA: lysophospholipid acyltransferase family protein [Chryseolinea sp.]|nr:lysophospholipid acyltransferase family protein [Chryseolinea sp.]HPH47746.1 lysophospholipid acyltransferase family protein [Chryseolinea sp.]HPM30141.1 lysophospholipid acyltransferase family protein [Chryseolinea sp.]